jgi:hypothetical protein
VDIEQRCKELGIEFVPYDDPRQVKSRKKWARYHKWYWLIRIKNKALIKILRLRRIILNYL